MISDQTDVTGLLKAWGNGDEGALEQLTPLVYAQLRTQARRYTRGERSGATLEGTALVHEVYLRLIDGQRVEWHDRAHFFALSAQLMRRILIDAARARNAVKRGGRAKVAQWSAADLDQIAAQDANAAALCALDDALEELRRLDPRRAKVIELRFFGGLSIDETAEILDISAQSVMRDWRLARAWLARELGGDAGALEHGLHSQSPGDDPTSAAGGSE
ncbi:MAG TPA: ECF-type sigma factor [Vicinamibacterales bacterium]|nr:ECF-type sigma factor [Vicinamibacterales bacterium]